jgi:hypothetical protein
LGIASASRPCSRFREPESDLRYQASKHRLAECQGIPPGQAIAEDGHQSLESRLFPLRPDVGEEELVAGRRIGADDAIGEASKSHIQGSIGIRDVDPGSIC